MPPFRAEHIGSLLRPRSLLDERARLVRGEIDRNAMRQAEDAAIIEVVRLQERLGFSFVTDGEFRRRSYHSYFYQQLGDLLIDAVPHDVADGGRGAQPAGSVRSRVKWRAPINVADYQFLATNSTRMPKITIPGSLRAPFPCSGDAGVLAGAYSDIGAVLGRHCRGVHEGTARALRCRRPLHPNRRNRFRQIWRPGSTEHDWRGGAKTGAA